MQNLYKLALFISVFLSFWAIEGFSQAAISNNIQVFPSSNHQSEVNISINKQNPNVLLLVSNVTSTTNSKVGVYWSANAGQTWTGADHMPGNGPANGDPSSTFDENGDGYVSTMRPYPSDFNAADGYVVLKTPDNGATWGTQVSGMPSTLRS